MKTNRYFVEVQGESPPLKFPRFDDMLNARIEEEQKCCGSNYIGVAVGSVTPIPGNTVNTTVLRGYFLLEFERPTT